MTHTTHNDESISTPERNAAAKAVQIIEQIDKAIAVLRISAPKRRLGHVLSAADSAYHKGMGYLENARSELLSAVNTFSTTLDTP